MKGTRSKWFLAPALTAAVLFGASAQAQHAPPPPPVNPPPVSAVPPAPPMPPVPPVHPLAPVPPIPPVPATTAPLPPPPPSGTSLPRPQQPRPAAAATDPADAVRMEVAAGTLLVHSSMPAPPPTQPAPAFEQLAGGENSISEAQAASYLLLANDFLHADQNRDGRISKREYDRWTSPE